jgi:hypothetical protein
MAARLIERDGDRAGPVYDLHGAVTTIGRAGDNTIVVGRAGISRHHAEVRQAGDAYELADLGSKNGTWVNGRRLSTPHLLQFGDLIVLPCRPVLQFVFETDIDTETVFPEQLTPHTPAGDRPAAGTAHEELRVNARTAEVWVRGRQVTLTAKEYRVLVVLYQQRGAVVSKQVLALEVWPEYGGVIADESIEQLISRLRRKVEVDPEQPHHLLTVRGLGYRLVPG